MGTGGSLPCGWGRGVELEADHSPASSAEVKNERSYTSTHLDAVMALTGKTLTLHLLLSHVTFN